MYQIVVNVSEDQIKTTKDGVIPVTVQDAVYEQILAAQDTAKFPDVASTLVSSVKGLTPANKDEAQKIANQLKEVIEAAQDKIVKIAFDHNLYISFSDGRELDNDGWSGGKWLSSSYEC